MGVCKTSFPFQRTAEKTLLGGHQCEKLTIERFIAHRFSPCLFILFLFFAAGKQIPSASQHYPAKAMSDRLNSLLCSPFYMLPTTAPCFKLHEVPIGLAWGRGPAAFDKVAMP